MEIYDLFMLGVFIVAILFGAMKGLAWQIASAAALFGSYVVAITFHGPVSLHINAEPPWNKYLAMFVLYLGTSFAVWIGFAFVRRMIEKVELKDFDRQAGAVVGAINGTVFCLVITFFAMTLPFLNDDQKGSISRSKAGYLMAAVVDQISLGMPGDVDRAIRPYLDQLGQGLQRHSGGTEAQESGAAPDDSRVAADNPFQVPSLGGIGSRSDSGTEPTASGSIRAAEGSTPGRTDNPWADPRWRRLAEEIGRAVGPR